MNLLFTTEQRDAASTILNFENFKRIGDIDGIEARFFENDFAWADCVIFMGYDPQIAMVRSQNPNATVGVVDCRPGFLDKAAGADFLVSNGPEMSVWGAAHFPEIFEYPIYPRFRPRATNGADGDRIVIGYHGNRVHICEMADSVSKALDLLSAEFPIELMLVYDERSLGRVPSRYLPTTIPVRHVQWHEKVYEQEIATVDIGIVPNLMPIPNLPKALRVATPREKGCQPTPDDFLMRFKVTSNPGRLLVFAQHGIPVVADMFPSAAQVVEHGRSGYLAWHAASWYFGLRSLCKSSLIRREVGNNLRETFERRYAIEGVNRRFVEFLRQLDPPGQVDTGASNIGSQRIFDRFRSIFRDVAGLGGER